MWVVAKTKPGATKMALVNLERQHFSTYAPRFKERVKRRNQLVEIDRYLFSTYVFVEVFNQWMQLSFTYGLSYILKRGDVPEPVPIHIIEDLRSREGDDGYYRLIRFRPGQCVKVNGGLLKGRFGVCEGFDEFDRVKVLFSGLSLDISPTLSVDDLEVA